MSGFLSQDDLDNLTEIKKGKAGKTRHELQAEFLRKEGIPFIESVRGRPRVTWAAIEGIRSPEVKVQQGWQPRVLSGGKRA